MVPEPSHKVRLGDDKDEGNSLAFLNLCLHGEFVFHFFEEYAVNRIKNYPNGFARTLRDWNKPPVENQRSRRPACIDPAIFKSVIEPLINDVLHPAKHNDFQLLHEGKFRCQCGGEVACTAAFTLSPYHSMAERMMMEGWEFDHVVSQNGLARYVYDKHN
ncbi:hypothetical protein RvY_08278-1 [Ramazzottius varieornatus]|uniref:Uncharacterized protein n=1 Tax=Ramazzottius varieornatus TaxID=947166 RepID=A0A1D1VB03_RAMVA|nr:hypothetical protein RvY_08278-1 [Ramazzottius varieornatus]